MTKRQQKMYDNYSRATGTTLFDIYKSFSVEKARALDKIRVDCFQNNGKDLRVFNANTFGYCAAYMVATPQGNELHYFTKDNNFVFMV